MSRKIIGLVLFTISMGMLVACDDIKTPNEKNFKKALQEYIDSKNNKLQVCLGFNEYEGNMIYIPEDSSKNKQAFLDLSKITSPKKQVIRAAFSFSGLLEKPKKDDPNTKAEHFVLTEKGISNLYGTTDNALFCSSGKYVVNEIVSFTEPKEFFGRIISNIRYTVKVEYAEKWVESEVIQTIFQDKFEQVIKQFPKDILGNNHYSDNKKHIFSKKLTLTNKGWIVD